MSMAVLQVRQYLLVAAVLVASVVTPGECQFDTSRSRLIPYYGPFNCKEYDKLQSLCTKSIMASMKCVDAVGEEVAKVFIAACIMDGCLDNSGLPACAVVSKFFELCSQQGVEVSCSDWQKAGCDVVLADPKRERCPAGLIYKCDAPACTPTCENPNSTVGCTLPNREGCVCPDGQLLAADGICYWPERCPVGCLFNGVLWPIGSTWTDPTTCASLSCVRCWRKWWPCPYGGFVFSTGYPGLSVDGKCINETAVCTVNGDPHYTTFDSLYFTYQGVSRYNLASVVSGSTLPAGFSEFKIFSQNQHLPGHGTAVSYVKYVELVIGGSTIRLSWIPPSPITLTINGANASIPYSGSSFNVFYSGSSVRLQTTFGVTVQFTTVKVVHVIVAKVEYAGRLHGLCGNNDGNSVNDWTLANGTSVAGIANAATILGDSFIIPAPGRRRRNLRIQPVTPLNPQNPCIRVPPAHHAGCNILTNTTGPLSNCINAIGESAAQIHYNNCLFDACFSNGSSICDSVMAFVSMCQEIGSPVLCQNFLSTPCAAQCPAGMTFQCAISSCSATCAVPDAPQTCTRPTIDSCACPRGQFLLDGRCTAECPIGCVDSALQFHEVGTSWPGTGCTVYTCESEGIITQSTCLVDEICLEKTCVPVKLLLQ